MLRDHSHLRVVKQFHISCSTSLTIHESTVFYHGYGLWRVLQLWHESETIKARWDTLIDQMRIQQPIIGLHREIRLLGTFQQYCLPIRQWETEYDERENVSSPLTSLLLGLLFLAVCSQNQSQSSWSTATLVTARPNPLPFNLYFLEVLFGRDLGKELDWWLPWLLSKIWASSFFGAFCRLWSSTGVLVKCSGERQTEKEREGKYLFFLHD